MPGLLDFLNTPESRLGIGLLAAAGPRADGAGAGQRIAEAMQMQDAYGQNQMRSKLLQSQIEENAQQAAYRKAQAEQAGKKQELLQGLLGGFGGVSTGGGVNMQGGTAQGGGLAGMTTDQIALLKANGIDLMEAWKIAQQGLEQKSGSYYKTPGGGTQYMPKLGEGMGVMGGQVQNAPGYAQANAQTEGMKAGAVAAAQYPYSVGQDAARQRLSAQLDPLKAYNPLTRREEYVPRAQIAQPQYTGPGYAGGSAQAAKADQLRTMQSELDKLPPNHPDRPAIEREMQRLGGGPVQSGNYAAGPSSAEEIAAAVERERALGQVKADIVPTAQRQNKLAAANDMLSVIDMLDKHPGRETATGVSGSIDPRNYIPGTDAKDFSVALDQLKGKTFLQAFETLKGGGQITEVEGAKATAAIARLNTAQSDKAFKAALGDLRGVVEGAIERSGAAPGSSDKKPASKLLDSLPIANSSNKGQRIRDTTTGKILRSNGMQWKEE